MYITYEIGHFHDFLLRTVLVFVGFIFISRMNNTELSLKSRMRDHSPSLKQGWT